MTRTVRRISAQIRRTLIVKKHQAAADRAYSVRNRMLPGSPCWHRADAVAEAFAHRCTAWAWLAAGSLSDHPAFYIHAARRSSARSYARAAEIVVPA